VLSLYRYCRGYSFNGSIASALRAMPKNRSTLRCVTFTTDHKTLFMKLWILALIAVLSIHASAQKPVHWKFSAKRIADKTYEIHLTARMDQPWHIYSQSTPPGGPAAIRIEFTNNPLVTISGSVKEHGALKTKKEKAFGVEVSYYEDKVDFIQLVKIKSNGKTSVTGYIQYMAGNEEQSLPITTASFNVALQ
jgi:hypothetical protein